MVMEMKKETKLKKILRRQKILFFFLKPLARIYSRLIWHFKLQNKYQIKKDESAIIIANHQTDLDFIHIMTSFKKNISPVATDTIFTGKKKGNFLLNHLGVIPKKKGTSDIKCAHLIDQRLKNNQAVLVHLEGNRTYAEFQFYMSNSVVRLLRRNQSTLVLFRLEGGTGVSPRFKKKNRRGPFSGRITKVLTYDEYKDLSDEEIFNIIKDGIKQFDIELHQKYKSASRAEYLERIFFICPKCHSLHTLVSKLDKISCQKCGLEVAFNEDLSLSSKDVSFTKMLDWWNFQKKYLKDYQFDSDIIFQDNDIELSLANPFEKKEILYEGNIILKKDCLIYGSIKHDLKDLTNSSVISGTKLSYQLNDDNYLIKSKNVRFNPLKYAFIFNKLDTKMKENNSDKFFNLEEN